MINPFKIKSNKRYTLNERTVIVEHSNLFKVIYYYLDEWWNKQPIKPKYIKSNILSCIFRFKKYKFV